MKRTWIWLAALAAILLMPACASSPKNSEQRAELGEHVRRTLDRFREADPDLITAMSRAHGFAVIPRVAKAGAGVGAAHGWGEVFERGRHVGYAEVTQATVGLQLGTQHYSELILFDDEAAMQRFQTNPLSFTAQTNSAGPGMLADAGTHEGVRVCTLSQDGVMLEISLGGQSLKFVPRVR